MNPPSPAIVAQNAVRRLPRWIMLLLCVVYVFAGFVGREPWREVDIAAFGYMQAMAQGHSSWLHPLLQGLPPESPGLLQYWLGALAIKLLPSGLAPELAVRLPFLLLLCLALTCTWHAVFSLARMPGAQPVAFAFGGEASPTDYARALADGGLLALLACLGLAQFSHETTHSLVQLSATCMVFFAAAAMWWQPRLAAASALIGLGSLSLAGAPLAALLLGCAAVIMALSVRTPRLPQRYSWAAWWLLAMAVAASAAWALQLWDYHFRTPASWEGWRSTVRLLTWFSWPAWPLALWALWRWRWQLQRPADNPQLAWPLWLWIMSALGAIFTTGGDRTLLLSLPAVAAFAAFALPTFNRSLGALIDWLTLFFFTVAAITIWVVWLSVQTGFPAKPAANVQRLAIGFEPSFSLLPFLAAVAATIGWLLLVAWRTRRHRAAIWKSLAVPAGGTVLGWVLLMTLWLPMLDYGRSYGPHIQALSRYIPADVRCVETLGASPALSTALQHYSNWTLHPAEQASSSATRCDWMVAEPNAWSQLTAANTDPWQLKARVLRPTSRHDHLLVLQRLP